MALRPLEEHVTSIPDVYDLLNNMVVGNQDQAHYIEKEGLHINSTPEDDKEDPAEEEAEDIPPQEETNDNPPSSSNPLAASSGTFDDMVSITFTHPFPSPRVTFEGLVG